VRTIGSSSFSYCRPSPSSPGHADEDPDNVVGLADLGGVAHDEGLLGDERRGGDKYPFLGLEMVEHGLMGDTGSTCDTGQGHALVRRFEKVSTAVRMMRSRVAFVASSRTELR
jgi:hypothetical protein